MALREVFVFTTGSVALKKLESKFLRRPSMVVVSIWGYNDHVYSWLDTSTDQYDIPVPSMPRQASTTLIHRRASTYNIHFEVHQNAIFTPKHL